LFVALAVLLLISGLHAAHVWHAALTRCAKDGSCGSLVGSNLSLANPTVAALVVATSVVPLLPGLFWGAPMVAQELETGTNQFAWTQSITRRRWLAVRTGWLLLAAALLAGAVSALVTWWSGPNNALLADAFQVNRFDITDIVPVTYAIFAMALGICAGTLLRRTLPALAVTLVGFVGLRALIALWLRLHYMSPVTAYYKLTTQFAPTGSYLGISQGMTGPRGMFVPSGFYGTVVNGLPVPPACQNVMGSGPGRVMSCMASHGYRGYLTYQPASRFWAFQGIETAIFVVLAAALLGVTFWVLKRRDA
jgi:ABC-type transport system involved in multi-copper enzyme maturation permease subunit